MFTSSKVTICNCSTWWTTLEPILSIEIVTFIFQTSNKKKPPERTISVGRRGASGADVPPEPFVHLGLGRPSGDDIEMFGDDVPPQDVRKAIVNLVLADFQTKKCHWNLL
jgi:hypothetical protein